MPRFANQGGDIFDVIVEPRYDTQTILAAGALQLNYFAVPLGQTPSNFGAATTVPKSLADTNMDLAGQLPAGFNFTILGFRLQPHFRLSVADSTGWTSGGWMEFIIAQKPFLRVPLDTVPSGCGVSGDSGVATAAGAVGPTLAHGWPMLQNGYSIARKPLVLPQTANFRVQLNWMALVPVTTVAPTQPAAGLTVRCYMDGILTRVRQ